MQKRIGELLRERRQAMGASLADVEGATLIRATYIDAIERGDYGTIPGKIYVRLYVKSYASFLGMDPQQAAGILDAEVDYDYNGNGVDPKSDSSAKRLSQKHRLEKMRRQAARRRTLNTAAAILLLTLIVLAVYFLAGGRFGGDSQTEPTQLNQAPSTEDGPAPVSIPPVDSDQSIQASAAEHVPKHKLTIRFTDDCWIRAYSDGTKVKEGIFKDGQAVSLEAETGIWVRLGNAGGAHLVYNGESLGSPGSSRKVMDVAFPSGYQPL